MKKPTLPLIPRDRQDGPRRPSGPGAGLPRATAAGGAADRPPELRGRRPRRRPGRAALRPAQAGPALPNASVSRWPRATGPPGPAEPSSGAAAVRLRPADLRRAAAKVTRHAAPPPSPSPRSWSCSRWCWAPVAATAARTRSSAPTWGSRAPRRTPRSSWASPRSPPRTRPVSVAPTPSPTPPPWPAPRSPANSSGPARWLSSTSTTGAPRWPPRPSWAQICRPLCCSPTATTSPRATQRALEELEPSGAQKAGGAQVILIGNVPTPSGYETTEVSGSNPAALARAIDALAIAAQGSPSDTVVIATAEQAPFAMPAAGWAAKSGDPVLYVTGDEVPRETREALRSHQQPRIYVLGPSRLISPEVTKVLREFGTVTRVGGQNAITNAVEFARFNDGQFGWGRRRPRARSRRGQREQPGRRRRRRTPVDVGQVRPAAARRRCREAYPGGARVPARHPARLRRGSRARVYNHAWIIATRTR